MKIINHNETIQSQESAYHEEVDHNETIQSQEQAYHEEVDVKVVCARSSN